MQIPSGHTIPFMTRIYSSSSLTVMRILSRIRIVLITLMRIRIWIQLLIRTSNPALYQIFFVQALVQLVKDDLKDLDTMLKGLAAVEQ
jgi:hypothetical protein